MGTATVEPMPDGLTAVRSLLQRLDAPAVSDAGSSDHVESERRRAGLLSDARRATDVAEKCEDIAQAFLELHDQGIGDGPLFGVAVTETARLLCSKLRETLAHLEQARQASGLVRRQLESSTRRQALAIRTLAVVRPELVADLPPDLCEVVWTVRVPPLAYLRAMGNMLWSAVRHPLSDTTIELETGRVLYRT